MLVEEINNMFRVSVHDLEDFDGLVSTWVACPQCEKLMAFEVPQHQLVSQPATKHNRV